LMIGAGLLGSLSAAHAQGSASTYFSNSSAVYGTHVSGPAYDGNLSGV